MYTKSPKPRTAVAASALSALLAAAVFAGPAQSRESLSSLRTDLDQNAADITDFTEIVCAHFADVGVDPPPVCPPVPGTEQRTWYVNSRLLLNLMGDTSDDHYLPIYESRLPECAFPDELSANVDCLKDPIPDPCGLWQWEKTGSGGDDDTWYVRATQGFNFRTISFEVLVPPSDPSDPVHYGWEDCREACLVDPQCVGASIERVLEVDNALSCKLIARSSASDNSEVAFRNNAVGPRQVQANNWASRDSILFAEAILSVCPAPTTP